MNKPRRDRPLIGITPDVSAEPRSGSTKAEPLIVLQERYARAIQQAGAIPLILPIMPSRTTILKIVQNLDGVIVSGGNFDIDPKLYGEKPIEGLGHVKAERTRFELGLISVALERDLPILGICGGAQAIIVVLGGSLYQDIASQIRGATEHQLGALKDRGGHRVKVRDGTKLRRIVQRDTLEVNTTHHQAVKKLGKGLIVNAAAEDRVIEGIESRDHSFVIGVQWHPEFLTHRDSVQKKIFSAFVSACQAR